MTAVAAALTTTAACQVVDGLGAGGPGPGGKADVSPGDRQILGVAAPYPADPSLSARDAELRASQAARRAEAWKIVGRLLEPVPIAETDIDLGDGEVPTVPRWQTWYDGSDVDRMFRKLYKDLGPAGRKLRAPFSAAALEAVAEWNAALVGELESWPEQRYLERLDEIDDDLDVGGIGAGHRVAYSPGLVRHLLSSYARAYACLPELADLPADAGGLGKDNFTWCFDDEFPIDAVAIKADWRRAEFGFQLPAFDTTATAITAHAAGDASWGDGDRAVDPGADDIVTVRLDNGNEFRLAALHIMTKELRHWTWITLWWSDQPDTDFGADRPAEIAALPGPWRHYKMCVATGFVEQDGDPRGGFPGSLGDALAAANTAGAGASWCSNPYLELGAGNAATNCIGCHQHAGTGLDAAVIASSPEFPAHGRTALRNNFPSDYLWAFERGDDLSRAIADEIEFYDSTEESQP